MRTIAWVAILLAAGVAGAQQDQGTAKKNGNGRAASDAFYRACTDMVQGKLPEGEHAIRTLQEACSNLMSGRADDKIQQMKQQQAQAAAREQLKLAAAGRPPASVQPGQSSAQPQQGTGVAAAFSQAAGELTGRSTAPAGPGMLMGKGPASWTLFTDPVGWFDGLGVNAQFFGSISSAPKFSWVAGARYSSTDATNGTATTFGMLGGADWFIRGAHNEGLRVGPRLELSAGRERFGSSESSNTFARLGMSGEVGYNFLASNGLSAAAAVGLGGRVAGDSKNENFSSFVGGEFGPYLSLGIGYSW